MIAKPILSADDYVAIYSAPDSVSSAELAERFGCEESTIWKVWRRSFKGALIATDHLPRRVSKRPRRGTHEMIEVRAAEREARDSLEDW